MTLGSLHRVRSLARSAFAPEGSDALDRAAFLMLLVFLIAQPLVYGSILPASMDAGAPAPLGNPLLNVFAFLTACAALLSRSALLQMRPLRLPLLAAGGLTLLGVVQLLPLPEGVLRQFASVNLQIYHETARILSLFGSPRSPLPSVSIAPWETVSTVLAWLSCLSLFFAAISLMRSRARRRVFGWAVLASAGLHLIRLAALRAGVAGPGFPLAMGFSSAAAGCVGISLCVVFGMIWAEVLTSHERGMDSPDATERFELRFAPIAGRVVLWLALAAGLASIRESPAVVSAAVAMLVLVVLAFGRRRREVARRQAGAAMAVVLAAVLLASGAAAAAPDSADVSRATVWDTTLAAWRQFPILGSGLGTFREAFRLVQPRDLPGLVDQAQSSALALLVTGGAIGLALGAIAALSLLVILLRAWAAQKHREESAIALGAFGALLFWALAGLIDPGTTPFSASALLAPVLGTGWAASQARGGRVL